jgi:hypothetical protein
MLDFGLEISLSSTEARSLPVDAIGEPKGALEIQGLNCINRYLLMISG